MRMSAALREPQIVSPRLVGMCQRLGAACLLTRLPAHPCFPCLQHAAQARASALSKGIRKAKATAASQ